MRSHPVSENLAERLLASVGQATSPRTTPGLYRALLRLLVRGEPVTIAELAAAAGSPPMRSNAPSPAGATPSTTHKAASLAGD
jgi:Helix-turn-helix domain of alkylmercury lyase